MLFGSFRIKVNFLGKYASKFNICTESIIKLMDKYLNKSLSSFNTENVTILLDQDRVGEKMDIYHFNSRPSIKELYNNVCIYTTLFAIHLKFVL